MAITITLAALLVTLGLRAVLVTSNKRTQEHNQVTGKD